MNKLLYIFLFIIFSICNFIIFFNVESYINYKNIPKSKNCLKNNPFKKKKNFLHLKNYILPEVEFNVTNFYIKNYTYTQIKNILNNIKINKSKNNYQELESNTNVKFNDIRNNILYIQNIILDQFKKEIKLNYKNLRCSTFKNCIPIVIDKNLIKLEKYKTNYKYTIILEILITSKSYSFALLIAFEVINKQYLINNIKLIGINFTDKIYILPGFDNKNILNTSKHKYQKKIIKKNLFPRNFNKEKLIDKILYQKKSCYGKKAINKNECELDYNQFGKKITKGIWK